MKHQIRNLAIAAALVAGGGLIGAQPAIQAAPGPVDSSSDTILSTGPRTFFVPISSYRAYDSRTDTASGKIDARQAGDFGRNPRPVFAAFENQNLPDLFDSVPGDVVAVTYNVQAVRTEGSGFMHIDGFFTADGSASTLVWSTTGERVSNSGVAYLTSAFDQEGALGVYVGGGTGRADVVIDITGFYVDADT